MKRKTFVFRGFRRPNRGQEVEAKPMQIARAPDLGEAARPEYGAS